MTIQRNGEWRARLRAAVDRSGRKHAAIARDAGIAPETLSRILTAAHARPAFDTIVRITHAAGESVGWLLGERGHEFSSRELSFLRETAAILHQVTSGDRVQPRRRQE
jgi:hypothetical protein